MPRGYLLRTVVDTEEDPKREIRIVGQRLDSLGAQLWCLIPLSLHGRRMGACEEGLCCNNKIRQNPGISNGLARPCLPRTTLATDWRATSAVFAGSGTARSTPKMTCTTIACWNQATRVGRGSRIGSTAVVRVPETLNLCEIPKRIFLASCTSHEISACLWILFWILIRAAIQE